MGSIDQPSIIGLGLVDVTVLSQSRLNKQPELQMLLLGSVREGSLSAMFNNLPVNTLQTAPVTRRLQGLCSFLLTALKADEHLPLLCVVVSCVLMGVPI